MVGPRRHRPHHAVSQRRRHVESTHGWGAYRLDGDGWSYAFQHSEGARGTPGAPLIVSDRPLAKIGPLKVHRDGRQLTLVGSGSDRREYQPNRFVQFGDGGILRVWERIE